MLSLIIVFMIIQKGGFMIPFRNIGDLNLTDEQLKTYKALEQKEQALRKALISCKVNSSCIEKVINTTDLNKMPDDSALLSEMIKETWKDFIY